MKTCLTFYGGKQRLAREIVALMPPHEVYLEPFAGGAAVLFAKPPAPRETLNDLDGTIMRFWRVPRERPEELARVVACTPFSRAEWNASGDLEIDDDLEAARRLLCNVKQSYYQMRGNWVPPRPTFPWLPGGWHLPPKILHAAERLRHVWLECDDALNLIPHWDVPGALIYADPPYTGRHRDNGRVYHHDDHAELWPALVEVLRGIEHAAVILSGYPCAEADALGWRTVSLKAERSAHIRAGAKRTPAPETLWLSPNVPEPTVSTLWDLEAA